MLKSKPSRPETVVLSGNSVIAVGINYMEMWSYKNRAGHSSSIEVSLQENDRKTLGSTPCGDRAEMEQHS